MNSYSSVFREKADVFIANDYSMSGTIPLPISLFLKIGQRDSLRMHRLRKRTMPDTKFNEKIFDGTDGMVKLQVNLTGALTGVIAYTGNLRGAPLIPPFGRSPSLPNENFTYFVRNGKIYKTIGKIPKDAGVQALA